MHVSRETHWVTQKNTSARLAIFYDSKVFKVIHLLLCANKWSSLSEKRLDSVAAILTETLGRLGNERVLSAVKGNPIAKHRVSIVGQLN
jgi:hypothetical protein